MNTTAFLARCLLLVLLQAIINSSVAGPAPKVPCPKGKDAGCNITTTGQLEPENCKGDECTSTDSDQIESSVADNVENCGLLNCSKEGFSVREAFNKAHFVVRGKVMKTLLKDVNYVTIEVMVPLVMKHTHKFLTPGKLTLVVPMDDWMCECPGAYELEEGESYLITGKVHKENPSKSDTVLRVNHHSLVRPWENKILLDMEENRSEYHKLNFRPNLRMYKNYFPD